MAKLNFPRDEKEIGEINAIRKGKKNSHQAPCKVGVTKLDYEPNCRILRTQDANGTAPIVIVLTIEQAKELAEMLLQ